MVKLEVTAGTNINHIRRTINTQQIQKSSEMSNQAEQNGTNHSTLLAFSLGEYQSQFGFFQAYELSLSKLQIAQQELLKIEEKSDFDKQLEKMMDIVDNTIFAGESLFGKGIEHGLNLGSLEGIESEEDIQNLGEIISNTQENLSQNLHETSVALINILSAMGTQSPPESELENHTAQLERIRKLLDDI